MALQLTVPNITCSACIDTVAKAVTAVDPSAKEEAGPKTKRVNVKTQTPEAEIRAVVTASGYSIA